MAPGDVSGIVIPGRGLGAKRMADVGVNDLFLARFGFTVVPGTLNVRLAQPFERRRLPGYLAAAEIAPEWEATTGQAGYFIAPALVAGRHRAVAFQADEPDYPADQLELLCEVRLREELGLADGDAITFSLE